MSSQPSIIKTYAKQRKKTQAQAHSRQGLKGRPYSPLAMISQSDAEAEITRSEMKRRMLKRARISVHRDDGEDNDADILKVARPDPKRPRASVSRLVTIASPVALPITTTTDHHTITHSPSRSDKNQSSSKHQHYHVVPGLILLKQDTDTDSKNHNKQSRPAKTNPLSRSQTTPSSRNLKENQTRRVTGTPSRSIVTSNRTRTGTRASTTSKSVNTRIFAPDSIFSPPFRSTNAIASPPLSSIGLFTRQESESSFTRDLPRAVVSTPHTRRISRPEFDGAFNQSPVFDLAGPGVATAPGPDTPTPPAKVRKVHLSANSIFSTSGSYSITNADSTSISVRMARKSSLGPRLDLGEKQVRLVMPEAEPLLSERSKKVHPKPKKPKSKKSILKAPRRSPSPESSEDELLLGGAAHQEWLRKQAEKYPRVLINQRSSRWDAKRLKTLSELSDDPIDLLS